MLLDKMLYIIHVADIQADSSFQSSCIVVVINRPIKFTSGTHAFDWSMPYNILI